MSAPTVVRSAATGSVQPADLAEPAVPTALSGAAESADLAEPAVPAVPSGPAESADLGEPPEPAVPAGLVVLARSRWPGASVEELPAIAGFITSSFSPLAATLAELCLRSYFGPRPADPARAERTAIVLASTTGDIATAAAIASAVDEGRRVPPLLFFQSNPNAVAGHIAARWGLAGPVMCTIPAGDALADAIASAALLIEDDAATAALIIVAHTGGSGDVRGVALLIGPESWPAAPGPAGAGSRSIDPAIATPAHPGDRSP